MLKKFFVTRSEIFFFSILALLLKMLMIDLVIIPYLAMLAGILYLLRKNKLMSTNVDHMYTSPIEGNLQKINEHDQVIDYIFETNWTGPWGIGLPCESVLEDYYIKGPKYIKLKLKASNGPQYQLKIYPKLFPARIWMRPGDQGRQGAFIGYGLGPIKVILRVQDTGDNLLQSKQNVQSNEPIIRIK